MIRTREHAGVGEHDLSVLIRGSDTLLARAHTVGAIDVSDVQLARTLSQLTRCPDDLFELTTALGLAAVRAGSTVLDLEDAEERFVDVVLQREDLGAAELSARRRELLDTLQWPTASEWADHLSVLPPVGDAGSEPNSVLLRVVGHSVYLERYWLQEELVVDLLHARQVQTPPVIDEAVAAESLARLYPADDSRQALQRLAVERALTSWTTVVAGGPGTGKTRTVARVLAAVAAQFEALSLPAPRVALAAPSGKAASRLRESVAEQATELAGQLPPLGAGQTLHSLLGARGLTGEYRAGPLDQLPHDVVVVDEVSMVDLHQFGILLSAVRPTARLLLVGDPQQLKSVSAGTVLADVVRSGLTVGGGSGEPAITELTVGWRNEADIQPLAEAIRARDVEAALAVLDSSQGSVRLVELELNHSTSWDSLPDRRELVSDQWNRVVEAAQEGRVADALAGLDRHRVLCGHREGPWGVSTWTAHTLELLRRTHPGFGMAGEYYPGRPVILTTNDRALGLSNGDTGVVVATAEGNRVALNDGQAPRTLSPALLRGVDSVFAMTVHKGQGSQFDQVTVILPPLGSPLLTRDLVYTAITRAISQVTIVGTREQLRAAIGTESPRASGLASRWRVEEDGPAIS